MKPSSSSNDALAFLANNIVNAIDSGDILTRQDIERYKKQYCKRHKIKKVPTNADILYHVPLQQRRAVVALLRKKPVRTLSGVAIVAVMTAPYPCPHGRCVPCPGGPPLSAQSYTGKEPAAQRAIRHDYDPYDQTSSRLEQLQAIGHPTDKIELVIMGGTFTARDLLYQNWFVQRCYDAMNNEPSALLHEAIKRNETAAYRCVGMTVETRPDWCRLHQVDNVLCMGATRIELGIQILDDRVLHIIQRGHTVADVIDATRLCKDAGLKVCYHIMPGLPGSNARMDMDSFRHMIDDPGFRPDMLKIYPTLVVRPSLLYERWQENHFIPLQASEAIERIADMKMLVPPWIRIQRIERDIPAPLIEAGITKSNLRQMVHEHLASTGRVCRCIRCREAGHQNYKRCKKPVDVTIRQQSYSASGGEEVFISAEDAETDILVGYCRLRFPGTPYRPELNHEDALIRELRVTGPMVPIGNIADDGWQHQGWGHALLETAEQVAADAGKSTIAILSGIGVKPYYRLAGYHDAGVYMRKTIEQKL